MSAMFWPYAIVFFVGQGFEAAAVRYLWADHKIVAIVLSLDIMARTGDCAYGYYESLMQQEKTRANVIAELRRFADKVDCDVVERPTSSP